MVIVIYQKIKILYLNENNKTDWLDVELDLINRMYINKNNKIPMNDLNIKAVLFNDNNIFNSLIKIDIGEKTDVLNNVASDMENTYQPYKKTSRKKSYSYTNETNEKTEE